MSKIFALYLFGVLYFVQGSAVAYVSNFQKAYLAEMGISPRAIGILTMVLLTPFVFKVFLGWLSDRVPWGSAGLRRKPYLFLGLLLASLGFGLCVFVSPRDHFGFFAILITMAAFGVALFDATADGLALEVVAERDQGLVQSSMVGGKAAGLILLSLLFGWVSARYGYRPLFVLVALSMLLPLPAVMRLVEPQRVVSSSQGFSWLEWRQSFSPAYISFAVYAVMYSIVAFGVDGLMSYSLSRRYGAPPEFMGHYGALRGLGSVLGAVLAGVALSRVHRLAVGVFALGLLAVGAIWASLIGDLQMILPFGFLWGFVWAFQETSYVTFAMQVANPKLAATSFSMMMAFSNLGTALVEGVATPLAAEHGFPHVFRGLGLLMVVVMPLFILSVTLARRQGRVADAVRN